MNKKNLYQFSLRLSLRNHHTLIKLISVIPLILGILTSYSTVQAQLAKPVSNTVNHTPPALKLPSLPDNGAPIGRRRGGAGRPECPAALTRLAALVPGVEKGVTAAKSNSTSFLASTVAEYPTFWVYVPELPTTVSSAEFVLQVLQDDGDEQDVLRFPIVISKPGIASISLPQNPQYSLQFGKIYHWYLKVYCGNPKSPYDNFYIDAWVQRVAMTSELKNQLQAKPSDYTAYAANNIWYDALTNLAELRRTNPLNATINRDWVNLLKAGGLEDLAGVAIVQHYSLEK